MRPMDPASRIASERSCIRCANRCMQAETRLVEESVTPRRDCTCASDQRRAFGIMTSRRTKAGCPRPRTLRRHAGVAAKPDPMPLREDAILVREDAMLVREDAILLDKDAILMARARCSWTGRRCGAT